jgi:hypothetical protein
MMWEFQGLDPDIEGQIQLKMNKSQWKGASYLAIGRWVLEYKKYLAKTMGNNHDYNIDCRGLQVLMIIILSSEIATSSGTNNPTLENDS